ncbi:MAG TPA: cytochrome c biogenesis protein ResB [Thioalkalivibrio sp.]|nr:cytochrome c biogenesis protein ResB [Thioalkalivibrio sp.]
MNLAITLLVALAIASVIGTVLQQNQPYTDYILKFGPFWHDMFMSLSLYNVYSATWFVVILGFLVMSTSVCVYRNAPTMLRDMRHFRLNAKAKSLRAFHHVEEREIAARPDEATELAARFLAVEGYRMREKDHGDHRVLAGMRGGWNRMGYLFTHVAIVIICIGGLMDGQLPLKIAETMGTREIETRDVPASQVSEKSRIGPGNMSFRGSVDIPEGTRANIVFLPMREGYFVQELPFAVEVKEFRVEHYDNGQPKSFESDLVIHDDQLDEPLHQTISVNHPLVYRGHAIYQSSFGDGGSRLGLRLWPLDTQTNDPVALRGRVFENYPVETAGGTWRLELADFRLFNINPVVNEEGKTEQRNMGPAFTFRMRDETGVAREYMNYMVPVEQEGRPFYISGVRQSQADAFRYLHIPADENGTPELFMAMLTYLQNPAAVREIAEATALASLQRSTDPATPELSDQLATLMARMLELFAEGGFDAIERDIVTNVPAEAQQEAASSLMSLWRSAMQALYLRVLTDRGVAPAEADWQFFDDAVAALASLPFYGNPYYIQLSEFEQVEASGLQITKSPGKDLVYFGSVMLTIGIFLLFYLAHRRLWVWVEPTERGSRVIFAGTSNRNVLEFDKQFARLKETLFGLFKA